MSTKEVQEKLVDNMKKWQKIENASIHSTGKIMDNTENQAIRQVMEIIQQDSSMHYRVQGLIADSLTKEAFSLNPEELADVWDMIESHIKLEKQTIEYAKEALDALKGKKMVIQEYFLNYLMIDEEKHNQLLDTLEKIKSGMYPYG
ncbi:hypothetical protein ACFL6G_05495 [candidate division KSB1 bacterium]